MTGLKGAGRAGKEGIVGEEGELGELGELVAGGRELVAGLGELEVEEEFRPAGTELAGKDELGFEEEFEELVGDELTRSTWTGAGSAVAGAE